MVSCRTIKITLPKNNTKHTEMVQERSQDRQAPPKKHNNNPKHQKGRSTRRVKFTRVVLFTW